MLNKITNFIDTHPIGRIFKLGRKKAVWKKVSELKPGLKIAICGAITDSSDKHLGGVHSATPEVEWDEIVSIKKVGRERVYDIEVEGTHNFVGNGIVAHNTYISDKIGAFAELIAANIRAGAVETKEFVTGSFTAFQATIDNLLITGGLVSPVVQTNLISPLADESDVIIKIGKSATSPFPLSGTTEGQGGFGQLIIQDATGSAVASIDTSGNATFSGTVNSQELAVNNDATVSGTLYADEIRSKTLEEIEELLRQVETNQNLLAQAQNWEVSTASDSANLEELALNDLYVTDQAAINSLSVSNSFALGSDFVISYTSGESITATPDVSIGTSINTLTAPLALQSLAMAPIEIMAGKIKIETNGDVTINANLFVAGKIESESIKTKEITTERLVIANATTSEESSGATSEVSTNATAGKATIPAGVSEITINNPNISDYSLIYVTPTSTTQNNVLFVKSKEIGKFVVGFTNPIDIDVSFNWWVIETQSPP